MESERIEMEAVSTPSAKVFQYIGAGRPRPREEVAIKCREKQFLNTLDLKLDKETGNTNIVVTGKRDLEAEIQAARDDAGFENMRKLIATGQALPGDFADDGKHGADLLGVPDNINDAYQARLKAEADAKVAAEALGMEVPSDESKIQELVDKRLQEIIDGLQAKKAEAAKDGTGEGDKK